MHGSIRRRRQVVIKRSNDTLLAIHTMTTDVMKSSDDTLASLKALRVSRQRLIKDMNAAVATEDARLDVVEKTLSKILHEAANMNLPVSSEQTRDWGRYFREMFPNQTAFEFGEK